MSTVVDELVTLLGFKLPPESINAIKKYTGYLDKAKQHAEKLYVGLMTAGAAVQAFAMKEMVAGASLYKLGERMGQSTDAIQKWAYAMEQAGGSSEGMHQDMSTLTKALRPVMPGDYNQGLYGLLGFDYTSLKDVDALMQAINKRFQGMSQVKAVNWAQQIGLSPEMAVLMRKPWEEIKGMFSEMRDMGGFVSEHDLEASHKFEKQYDKIKATTHALSLTIAGKLAPAATEMLKTWQKWIVNNREWLSSKITEGMKIFNDALRGTTDVLQWMLSGIRSLLGPFEKYAGYVSWAEVALWSLTGATIAFAVATIAAVGPWVLLGVGIAAAGYIIYDAIQYFRGMDSTLSTVITTVGELAKKFQENFPGISALIKELYSWVKMLAKVLTSLVLGITKPIFKLIGDIMGAILVGVDKILQKFGVNLENAKVFAKEMEKLEKQGAQGANIIGEGISGADDKFKKLAVSILGEKDEKGAVVQEGGEGAKRDRTNSLLQSLSNGIDALAQVIPLKGTGAVSADSISAVMSPVAPNPKSGAASTYAPNTTIHQNNTFNTKSTDPKKAAGEISEFLGGEYKNMLGAIYPGSALASGIG